MVSVIIPNSVTSLGYLVFEGCTSLKDVYCYAENVPKDYGAFTDNIENATLYVPAASLGQYETTAPWSGFGKIVPLTDEETAINLPQAEENWTENEVQQIYTLDGKPAKTLQKGVIILRTSDGQTKKVLVK